MGAVTYFSQLILFNIISVDTSQASAGGSNSAKATQPSESQVAPSPTQVLPDATDDFACLPSQTQLLHEPTQETNGGN